jgi:hypothetical protein
MMMATPETPGAVRRLAHVTDADGHTETLNLSKPMILYEATSLEGGLDDPGKFMFILAWVAAGKPGMNGGSLTINVAVEKMEAWLAKLEALDFEEQPITGLPPTKRPKPSRASRASSDGR